MNFNHVKECLMDGDYLFSSIILARFDTGEIELWEVCKNKEVKTRIIHDNYSIDRTNSGYIVRNLEDFNEFIDKYEIEALESASFEIIY